MKVVLLVLVLLSLAWIGSAEDLTLNVGQTAPELKIFKFGGGQESLTWKDFQNQFVILDFWASWCEPCIKEIPRLNAFVKEFQQKPVRFVSITYETPEMVEEFVKKHPMETLVAIDQDFATFRSYKAWGIPMAILVNPKGKVVSVIHPSKLTKQIIHDVLAGKIPDVEQHTGWDDPEGAEEYFRSLIVKKQ